MRFSAIEASDIIIHIVAEPDDDLIADLQKLGVGVRRVPPVSSAIPTLNKLSQLHSPELRDADVVILCDCDLVFLEDVRPHAMSDRICGVLVSQPNPGLPVWEALLADANLPMPPTMRCIRNTTEYTVAQNFNGGVLMIPRPLYGLLVEAWPRWSSWLESRLDVLGGKRIFCDQVAFAMACVELDLPIRHLPPAYNYPVPAKTEQPIGGAAPKVLHYHDEVGPDGLILHTGCKDVDACIDRANDEVMRVVVRQRRNSGGVQPS